MRRRSVATVAGATLALVACGGGEPSGSTLPFDEPLVAPADAAVADDLAPSQVTASTVVAPDTPGPCDLHNLEFWTAQVFVGERSADALVRVRNNGDVWCEPDISNSPLIDSEIEPDVWLDPGGWADLIVGQSGRECFAPEIVTLAELDIDGESVVVPTAAVAMCGWELTAFYPSDVSVEPCGDLDTALTDRFVLIRNAGFTACVLGELTAVDGNRGSTVDRTDTDVPAVIDLGAGDVVAVPFVVDATVDCGAAPGSGTLTFGVAGPLAVAGIECGAVFELGAARPWYSDPNGPLSAFSPDSFDLGEVLGALDPFDEPA